MAFGHYKNGLFAARGGIDDQPVKYLEAMTVIQNEISLIEQEKLNARN